MTSLACQRGPAVGETISPPSGSDPAIDAAFIRRAIDGADLNALRLAMLHLTGDPALEAMGVEMQPRRGGALASAVVARHHVPELKAKAFALLTAGIASDAGRPVARTELRRLMENFNGGGALSDDEFALSCEELALEPIPRDVAWRRSPAPSTVANLRILIVGGGLSGISMGAQLGRLGLPYTIIERLDGVGGTWLRNTYPDVRVDTDCYNYQFKFDKKYPWKEYYPTQGEVLKYATSIAEKHGVTRNIRFRTEFERAVWDERAAKWRVDLRNPDGASETIEADFVISGAGLFGQESLPDIPGIDRFAGRIVHTSGWDHGFDYAGKSVALIGNGSSGVQVMPALARRAGNLTVFQRTPQWIGPIDNLRREFTREERWLIDTMPYYWNWCSFAAYATFAHLQRLQEPDPAWRQGGGAVNEGNDKLRAFLLSYIEGKVGGREDLLAKSIPPFPPLSRRLVVDNGWFDALLRDNVELVTDGIREFVRDGIVDGAGVGRAFDMVVLGTGFKVERYLAPATYVGRAGVTLQGTWSKDGPRAHLGMTVPGFPNFFMMYGPGSQARGGGLPSWIEIWTRYVAGRIVDAVEAGVRSIEIRQDVFDTYNAAIDEAARRLLWETNGKGGYYVTKEGRSIVNQPWRNYDYHAAIVKSGLDDFVVG